jgi:hypothetical protein
MKSDFWMKSSQCLVGVRPSRRYIELRLNPNSPSYTWVKIDTGFQQRGITSFHTSECLLEANSMKNVWNSATSTQPDNLRAGLV